MLSKAPKELQPEQSWEKNKDTAKEALATAEKTLDAMAGKKVISKNKASRTKSRLSKKVKAL